MSALLTFFIPVVLARQLDVAAYGTYKQFFLVAVTLYLGGQLGLGASLFFFVPRAGEERGRYVIQALAGLFIAGALAAAALLVFAGVIADRFDNPALAALALPMALYTWTALAAAPLETSLTACGKTRWSGLAFVLSDVARTAAMVAPVLWGWGLAGVAWAAAAFGALRLIAAWTLALTGATGRPLAPTRAALRRQLGYALPFAGAVVLAVAQMQLPQYVVAGLTDAATFAVFAVGALQLPVTDLIYAPIAEVMMVRLASTPGGEKVVFREAASRLCMFFLPLAAFTWAVAPELIVSLYSARYAAAVPIFAFAAAEILLGAVPVDGLLRALDQTRTLFRVNVIRLLLAAVAVPAGLILFGLPGAMAGYVATQFIAKGMLLAAAARRLHIRIHELLPGREIAAWAGRSALLFVAVTALRLEGPWHGWTFFLAAVPVAGAIWLLSLLNAGELRAREAPVA